MDTRGGNNWHTTEPWHNSPLPEGVSHAVTVLPGREGGRSGGPSGQTWTGTQDGDLQSGTDNSEAMVELGAPKAMAGAGSSGGHGGAGSSGGHGRWCLWPCPRSGPYSRNPFTPPPPQKKFPGEVRGYQEPSGAKHRHRTGQPSWARHTGQDSSPGLDKQDKTGPPTGTGSPPGLARKLRLLLDMTRSQGPSQGPSAQDTNKN